MGSKLLWTAVAVWLIDQAFVLPAGVVLAGVLAAIGIVLVWLDK